MVISLMKNSNVNMFLSTFGTSNVKFDSLLFLPPVIKIQ